MTDGVGGCGKEKARTGSGMRKQCSNDDEERRRVVHRRDLNPGNTNSADFSDNRLDKQTPLISNSGHFWGAKAIKGLDCTMFLTREELDSPRSWKGD